MHIVRIHTQRALPEAVLDELTFDDIADLRDTQAHREFVGKYDRVWQRAKRLTPIHDAEALALRLDELQQLEWELHQAFDDTIKREAIEAARRKSQVDHARLLGSIASAVTFYGVVDSLFEIAANTVEAFGSRELHRDVRRRTSRLTEKLGRLVDQRRPSDRDVLLRFLGQIAERYKAYLPE